jgi:hypothetical protein
MTLLKNKKHPPIFWIGILILMGLGAEVTLRLLKIPGTSYGNWVPPVYQPHPTIGYTFIPNIEATYSHYFEWETTIKANSEGWRDNEHLLEKPSGSYRIACIGDSYTVNLEVPMEENYPKTLERILNKEVSPRIEVLNFSADGTGTEAHYMMFKDYALKYKPDMVIHSFHDTDIVDVRNGKLYRQSYKNMIIQYLTEDELKRGQAYIDKMFNQGWGPLKHFFLRNSYLSRVVLHSFGARWRQQYMVYANRGNISYTRKEAKEARKKTKRLIRKFKALADENQISYVMVFLHYEDAIRGHDRYRVKKRIKGLLEELRITYLDTYEPFRQAVDKRKLYWKYDPHITEEGCKLIAETVSDFLLQNNFLPSGILEESSSGR